MFDWIEMFVASMAMLVLIGGVFYFVIQDSITKTALDNPNDPSMVFSAIPLKGTQSFDSNKLFITVDKVNYDEKKK